MMATNIIDDILHEIEGHSVVVNKERMELLEKIKMYEIKQQNDNIEITTLTQENQNINNQLNEQSAMMQDFINTICNLNAKIETLQQKQSVDEQNKTINNLKHENVVLNDETKQKHEMMLDLMKKNFILTSKLELATKEKSVGVKKHYEEYNTHTDLLFGGYFREIEIKINDNIPKVVMEICLKFFVSLLSSVNIIQGDTDCVID
eukprot:284069_1